MWWFSIGSIVTGTGRWELEAVDGKWEVLIIRIIDQEPVVNALLETLGLIALWDQWARGILEWCTPQSWQSG